ncbi:hypothetical protein Syun_006010 [Stephania yunnanensis]|uniref:Uncharacterized protein n=1 Tax=Stephania yunnanensis TaxID=152371 RepID=A0AAP0PYX5_9MAGN
MERGGNCLDGNLDNTNYSSPVPWIGLYIAVATLVCLLLILVDVIACFRNRKRWVPCRYFPLNSVTLTLLSAAVKLPLDLTTSMPSGQDQVSKITGTTLLCTCMAYFMPSLGLNTYSECFTNMAALTIFVITVVVNTCIQMHTGVIFLFRAQHIVILCCIIVLLMVLWHVSFDIHSQNEANIKAIKGKFTMGEHEMFRGLKKCYLLSYHFNPQFVLCRNVISILVAALCAICSVLLLEVSFRSLVSKKLEFCEGQSLVSDYKWSMRTIVVSQIIAVLVGTSITIFRALTWFGHFDLKGFRLIDKKAGKEESIILKSPILFMSSLEYFAAAVKLGLRTIFDCISSFISCFIILLYFCLEVCSEPGRLWCCNVCKTNVRTHRSDEELVEEFKDLTRVGRDMRLTWWTLWRGAKDMRKLMQNAKTLNELAQLLSRTPPSDQNKSLVSMLKTHYEFSRWFETSSISIVLLVRVATISIPSSLSNSLSKAFGEVFEIVHFVDRQMSSSPLSLMENFKLAKSLWESRNFNKLLLSKIVEKIGKEAFEAGSHLEQAIMIIQGLHEAIPSDYVWDELKLMTEFILQSTQAYGSVDELYGYIEQLFVGMLNEFLMQLPIAIFKYINERHAEDYEGRVKFALKLICKIELLEGHVQWSFPPGSSITRFVPDKKVLPLDDNTLDCGDNPVSTTNQDEIVQVE